MTIFETLAEVEKNGESCVLCTILSSEGSTPRHEGSKMIVFPDGQIAGTIGGGEMESRVISEALQIFKNGQSKRLNFSLVDPKEGDPGVCGGAVELYLEFIGGKPELLIVGGGHVGKAIAHLAKWLSFRVIISDDRAEFCTAEANPDADEFIQVAFKDISGIKTISSSTYIVVTTRGVAVDLPGLPPLLETNAAYIGVIGSKRRWLTTRKALEEQGIAENMIRKIHSPIGLELNAETPEEIAVSIMAEIIMLRNGGDGTRMAI